jgi:hypothetical protein
MMYLDKVSPATGSAQSHTPRGEKDQPVVAGNEALKRPPRKNLYLRVSEEV